MRRKRSNILIASTLAGLFALFNVGLPFILYVCPMMADERCACACTQSTTDGPALTYLHTSCCSNSVLAERNTVPFLGALKYEPPYSELMFVLPSDLLLSAQQPVRASFLAMADTGPPSSNTPLYLLSSSLLI